LTFFKFLVSALETLLWLNILLSQDIDLFQKVISDSK